MNMKRKVFVLLILFLIINVNLIWSQDFSGYRAVSMDWIDDFINGNIERTGRGGITIYDQYQNFFVEINFNQHPVPIEDEIMRRLILLFSDQRGYSQSHGRDFFINLFGHYYSYKYKDKDYIFFFQNSLVDPIKRDVQLGKNVNLYIMLGMYEGPENTVYSFVNAFKP